VIPEAAVEAAAEAIYERRFGPKGWDGLPDMPRKQYADDARGILEAAAPHMLAGAWDEGMQAMYGTTSSEWPPIPEQNPYRSQA